MHAKGETYAEAITARPYRALYKQRRWVRLSARVRAQEPLCELCRAAGRPPSPTRVVDHITPHRGDLRLFYARFNLQALCVACHNAKSRREQLA